MSGQRTPPVEKVGGEIHRGGKEEESSEAIPFSRPPTPSPRHDQLAFIGLGAMGKRMATNLAKHLADSGLPPLMVYNRSPNRVEEFKSWSKERGLGDGEYKVVKELKEIGRTADLILTSLGSDQAVEEVIKELFDGQEHQSDKGDGIVPGGEGRTTIFIDTSTIFPGTAGRLERLASSRPHRVFLSCPVFGVPKAAETADIVLAISGDYYAKKHAAHALVPAVAKKVMDLGSNVERAMSFKLVGNALELGFIELLSECFTLSDQAGVGSDKLLELIKDQHSSPALVRYGERIIGNKFGAEGGFTLGGGIVDARHIKQLAETNNVPMPVIDVANQHMLSARAHGGGEMDWTALVGGQRIAAGMEPFAGKNKLERYYEDT